MKEEACKVRVGMGCLTVEAEADEGRQNKARLISKQASWQGVDGVQRPLNPGREKRRL